MSATRGTKVSTIPADSKQRSRKIDIVCAKPNQRTQPTTQIKIPPILPASQNPNRSPEQRTLPGEETFTSTPQICGTFHFSHLRCRSGQRTLTNKGPRIAGFVAKKVVKVYLPVKESPGVNFAGMKY